MLIRAEHIDSEGKLGVWEITETVQELLAFFPETLRERAAKHISGMRSEKRILEWLAVRLMLFQLSNEEKIVHHHRNGQPYLTDNSLHISISHTQNYAAILLHPSQKVGIDIEFRSERVKRIAHKFISENEYIDDAQTTVHQLLHWSAKETMFKLLDEEEIHFRNHLHIATFTPTDKGVMKGSETKSQRNRSFDIFYEVSPDYVLTWAVEDKV